MTGLEGLKVQSKKDAASFDVDTHIYPLDAVLGTAYVFTNRAFVFLDQPGKGRVRVTLSGKKPLDTVAVKTLCGDFVNELLGQVLRDRAAKKYGKMREALLAKALFSAAPNLCGTAAPAPAPEAGTAPREPPPLEAAPPPRSGTESVSKNCERSKGAGHGPARRWGEAEDFTSPARGGQRPSPDNRQSLSDSCSGSEATPRSSRTPRARTGLSASMTHRRPVPPPGPERPLACRSWPPILGVVRQNAG